MEAGRGGHRGGLLLGERQIGAEIGQVRGVALLAAATQGLPVAEYAPLKIKSSVVGYGLAKKEQVQFMVARLLELAEVPQPADAADALAVAICHIHTAQTLTLQGVGAADFRLIQTASCIEVPVVASSQRQRIARPSMGTASARA